MSIGDDILIILTSYSRGYSLMRRRLGGYTGPAEFKLIKKNIDAREDTLRVTLSRLKKLGLVRSINGKWHVTSHGRKYIKGKIYELLNRPFELLPHKKYNRDWRKVPKNMIVSFDIPEKFKAKRNWLRVELASMGFFSIQKSVWLGPAPLDEDFIHAIKKMDILHNIKFFNAEEHEIV